MVWRKIPCSADPIYDGDDGPVIELDDERGSVVIIDRRHLIVASSFYRPERTSPLGYLCPPEFGAQLPAENGAVIHLAAEGHRSLSAMIFASDGTPLTEQDDRLCWSHRTCEGPECADPVCHPSSFHLAGPDVVDQIHAIRRRVGSKRIELASPHPPDKLAPQPVELSPLEKALKGGRTVTLQEYRRLTDGQQERRR